MLHLVKAGALLVGAKLGVAALNRLRASRSAPRLLKWSATAGLLVLALRK